ncbi:MAG: DUF547 domain-containing protein [Verrucomicrobia bacterium]|nr:MAG: DUF547 domain-containing protein [Verrucomicrobiota bacterium]
MPSLGVPRCGWGELLRPLGYFSAKLPRQALAPREIACKADPAYRSISKWEHSLSPYLPIHMSSARFAPWLLATTLGFFSLTSGAFAFDHGPLDTLLKDHVREGRVDYAALKEDTRLAAYLDALASADLATLPARNEQLAFWINAYNAVTLKLIVDHYPLKSIRDIPHPQVESCWDLPSATVGGRRLSLNEIEHSILRKELKEPRIHYAVVCAAVSCPPLRAEAYTAERLDAQFTAQAEQFLANWNHFDSQTRQAALSQIFNWFAVDFGSTPEAVLRSLAPYAPTQVRGALASESSGWTVTYLSYDWALNGR